MAVLAVDPTSSRTGGSILGRQDANAAAVVDPSAFIRPSPTAGTLGGVTRATRESIMVCEAAGFDVVLVETVGVGQSETLVAKMVDFFLVLMIPGAGDELQGIKKGVLELADMIAVNKADGDNDGRARVSGQRLLERVTAHAAGEPTWSPPVVTCSATARDRARLVVGSGRCCTAASCRRRANSTTSAGMTTSRLDVGIGRGPLPPGASAGTRHD